MTARDIATRTGRRRVGTALRGPQALAFMPALSLGAFWFGGEAWLLATALGLPALHALAGSFAISDTSADGAPRHNRARVEATLADTLREAGEGGNATACLMMAMDDADHLARDHGASARDTVMERCLARLPGALRQADRVFALPRGHVAVVLAPVPRLDLETMIQLSARVQTALEEPVSIDATAVAASWSVGFCTAARNPGAGAADLLGAAEAALADARRNGPSAIRAHSGAMPAPAAIGAQLRDDAAHGLETGQFRPWFQPQISTDTGHVSGFEALARWHHPRRGMIPPADFLPVLEETGNLERLAQEMVTRSLEALRHWDGEGLDVPCVAVNFAGADLRDPRLVDRIAWELDRFDLPPRRLTVEVLESVVIPASDDVVTRNIRALADLGCAIDLDDFGTGHASIASIRRFQVSRLKIDRSFVTRIDRDADQQRMLSAMLTMADQLGLDTLAEGVETAGEHAVVAELGCGFVQGFGIARPMPIEQTSGWIRHHAGAVGTPPRIGRATG
jgi:EAL domain-containing protein (putative c-di-GMP-specific phosphodiesterase class I)/GGDEF domain-containing protein